MVGWSIVVPRAEVARVSELLVGTPHPALAAHVLTYTARDAAPAQPTRWQVGQVGAIVVSIDLDTPGRTVLAPGSDSHALYPRHAVSGLRDRPLALVERAGPSRTLSVGLSPAGAHALFGLPLSEVANTAVDLTDLLGAPARRLVERLGNASGWAERFRLLDRQLLAWIHDGPELARPVHGAWQALAATSGLISIGSLADEVGWTRQHLVTRFRHQIGLTPKTVARLNRLHRAVSLMARARALPFADLAQACGYADQAHLTREFRALTGTTPGAYVPHEPTPVWAPAARKSAKPRAVGESV